MGQMDWHFLLQWALPDNIVEFISYEMQYRVDDACDFTKWIDDIVSTFFKRS